MPRSPFLPAGFIQVIQIISIILTCYLCNLHRTSMAKIFCTFIGINNYPVKPLSGCVLDVLMMDHLELQFISNSKSSFSGYIQLGAVMLNTAYMNVRDILVQRKS